MLTQHEVRKQLDTIADEVAQPAGLYYELYTRLYSQRVRRWIRSAPHPEAALIQRVAETDPDYLAETDLLAETGVTSERELTEHGLVDTKSAATSGPELAMHPSANQPMLFNPAWDMDY